MLTETIYKNSSYRYIFKMVIHVYFSYINHIPVTMYQYMWELNALLTFLLHKPYIQRIYVVYLSFTQQNIVYLFHIYIYMYVIFDTM